MRTPILEAIRKRLLLVIATIAFLIISDFTFPQSASAYPFWAQQTAPLTPREATGRIV